MKIITAQEVIKRSPAEANFPVNVICDKLDKYVRAAFKGCLGIELLELLEEDLINYNPIKWNEDETYADGTIVSYQGEVYEFKLTEVEDEIVTPDCSGNWIKPDKFMSDCYNEMYDLLCDYLALYIYGRVLPYVRYKAGGLGAFIQSDDGNGGEKMSSKDFSIYKNYIECECNECLETLKEWMKCQNDEGTCDFECAPFLQACNNCKDEVSRGGARGISFRW